MGRAIVLAQSGDHAKAVAETEAVLGKNVEGGLLYDAACAFSLASSAAAHDTQLGDLERTKLAEKHAARAVEVLRRAQQAGFFKQPGEVQHMRNDTDLDALRTRDDYKKFQSDVE
jgi:hypothetical protein